jgi:hypothetical protein
MEYLDKFTEGATYLVQDMFGLKTCVFEEGWFDVGYAKVKATSVKVKYLRS